MFLGYTRKVLHIVKVSIEKSPTFSKKCYISQNVFVYSEKSDEQLLGYRKVR